MLKVRKYGNSEINLICLPGGPGLSSSTLDPLIDLKSNFSVHLLDYCGTNGTPVELKNLAEISKMIQDFTFTLSGKKILLGHSYGGFLAASTAIISQVNGLICLGTPFSNDALAEASLNYSHANSSTLSLAEKKWIDNKSVENFNSWLAEYDSLYFNVPNIELGKRLLLNDLSSPLFFLNNANDITSNQHLLEKLKFLQIPKLFLAGETDGLLSPLKLRKDAEYFGFKYRDIPKANHFMVWDQKNLVISEITKFINTIWR
jgi:pimeloyl-ACP methyl ester carboxylesterase